jgi:hypothetical protein
MILTEAKAAVVFAEVRVVGANSATPSSWSVWRCQFSSDYLAAHNARWLWSAVSTTSTDPNLLCTLLGHTGLSAMAGFASYMGALSQV